MEYLWAFLIGGLFCAVGQILIDYTKLTPARILVSYVVIGVIISAFGWYKPLVEFAGGGASVPLTGFGHLLAEGKGISRRVYRRNDQCGRRYYCSSDFWSACFYYF